MITFELMRIIRHHKQSLHHLEDEQPKMENQAIMQAQVDLIAPTVHAQDKFWRGRHCCRWENWEYHGGCEELAILAYAKAESSYTKTS